MMELKSILQCIVLGVVAYLAQYNWDSGAEPMPLKDGNTIDKEYDFIVIGAGSTGSVIASRLTDNPDWRILLIETGDDDSKYPSVNLPIAVVDQLANPELNWDFKTVPQKHACQSAVNKQCGWPRGRVLGGTSSINGMMYVRGDAADYDYWAELGCEGWSHKDVLPYFKRAESVDTDASNCNGKDGPLKVESSYRAPVADAFTEACAELGYETNISLECDKTSGRLVSGQATINKGTRWNTANAYIRPVMHRDNFHILANSHVSQIVFDGKRAVGVEFIHHGRVFTVGTKREIILSAGVIGSPQILLLSGVGPKDHLNHMNIPLVANLPVGKNLQDHMYTMHPHMTFEQPVAVTPAMVTKWEEIIKYKLFGKGLLGTNIGLGHCAYRRSAHQPKEHKFPYIQLALGQSLFASPLEGGVQFAKSQNLIPEHFRECFSGVDGKHGIHIFAVLLHPKNAGTLQLKTQNPFDKPLIDANYLSDDLDMRILIEAVREAQNLLRTKAFKELGGVEREVHHPSCSQFDYDSDKYWECYLRHMAITAFHPTGTCRMGAVDDPRTVVDPKLRVKGLKGLRVADASIMPEIISGNTNAPCIMIGEKAADLIKLEN